MGLSLNSHTAIVAGISVKNRQLKLTSSATLTVKVSGPFNIISGRRETKRSKNSIR